MDVTQLNTKIANLEKTLAELKTLKAAYESTISKQELLDRYDFDCDGIISIIDSYIPVMGILGRLDGDPLYDENKQTYNGKSLDMNNDGLVNVADTMASVIAMTKEIKDVYDAELWRPTITASDGTVLEHSDIINNLYTQKGKVLPTLQELKDHVSQYNS